MKTKTKFLLLCIVTINLISVSSHAQVLITDSFESKDMSATNSDGFSWTSSVRTSIVTQHPTDGNVVVFNGSPIYNIVNDSRDWTAFDGDYSLRFRYAAGEPFTEQRFDLGVAYSEIWIRYWLRIPVNFSYGPGTPARNNKFFSLWMDGYEGFGEGSTIWLGMEPSSLGATLGFTYTHGNKTGSVGFRQHKPFISTADHGKWLSVVIHVKAETSEDANDGILQTYLRWQGEASYILFHEDLNLPLRIPTGGPSGFKAGYILGWANAPYEADTEWLLDSFTVSETSLLKNTTDLVFKDGFDNN